MEKKKKKPVNYVNNKDFFNAIVEYRKTLEAANAAGKEIPIMPDYIGKCIMMISEKLSMKPCFSQYSFRDEMVFDGIENCILYFHDYNPDKGTNPFAYFTQIIYYAFLRRISKEEKIRYAMYKGFQDQFLANNDPNLLLDHNDNHLIPKQTYDNISDFIDNYERKLVAKKEKKKMAKLLNGDKK